jgi:UvrB/uvrC motif
MTLTKGCINRAGKISFHDASLSIWEEGKSPRGLGSGLDPGWERQFKHDVFARIVQTLNRLGWTCIIPPDMIERYGVSFARDYRYCTKGDLQAQLEVGGRHIKLEIWQDVQNRGNPNGGRYDFDKARRMTYLQRLEMERTRRRIRDYLCNVFSGYEFEPPDADRCAGATAMEIIGEKYRKNSHFGPAHISDYHRRAADGGMIEHGARVWFLDCKGRILTGTAYTNGGMWFVVTGTHGLHNKSQGEIFTRQPENLRIKRNARERRKRLEKELSKAVEAMNFERAATLRDILFPGDPELFVVWHDEHRAYHGAGFSGYTADKSKAGRFTSFEVRGWDHAPNKVIALHSGAGDGDA